MAIIDSLVKIEDKEVKITNLEKIYWPKDGYTKYDLIKYYTDISPYLLQYVRGRPVNFQRFPDGIDGKRFYQKNSPDHAPAWIKTFPIASETEDKVTNYMMVEDVPTLVWLANLGCLEIHPWLSSTGSLQYPDYAVFDLDPPGIHFFPQVLEVAVLVKEALDSLKLKSYPKTSGSSGVQIFVPIMPQFTYEDVRVFTGTICSVVEKYDKRTTTERKVDARGERIYLDYLQNVMGKTINAPYSVRPLDGVIQFCTSKKTKVHMGFKGLKVAQQPMVFIGGLYPFYYLAGLRGCLHDNPVQLSGNLFLPTCQVCNIFINRALPAHIIISLSPKTRDYKNTGSRW